MPRQMRILSKSKVYHIMLRGNEKKDIFLDDEDREKFLSTIRDKNKENKWLIYAYCLMDNHVHLLINEGLDTIASIMKKINTSYAYYFNNKYKRVGHLLQDRFRSENIEDDSYLLAAVRYIHNNPVKAGIVKDASQYKWSSFNSYLKKSYDWAGIYRNTILEMLSEDEAKAVRLFVEFSSQTSDDVFDDYKDESQAEIDAENAIGFVGSYLNKTGQSRESLKDRKNIIIRNELIKELKTKSNLSVRQIASLLGLNKGMIQRGPEE
jgi:REP element-mobilizing transposase RayT